MMKAGYLVVTQYMKSRPEPRPELTDECAFRVWPWHMDLNGHLNNASYFNFANQARLVFLARAGILKYVVRNGYKPVLIENRAEYFKSLKLGERFVIRSRIVSSENERTELVHDFMRGDRCVARVTSVARLLGKKARDAHEE